MINKPDRSADIMLDFKNMSPMIQKAFEIASAAHKGAKDKAGADYILHPMTVASNVGDNEYAVAAALLHDVVEDTEYTLEELSEIFPEEVITALDHLTHCEGEPYMEYVKRAKADPIAKTVKKADLEHNMDLSRFKKAAPNDIERLEKKYRPAMELLLSD